MKQRFLNQRIGKHASHRAELNKARDLLKKSAGHSQHSPALSGAGRS
jgi:hypothetical protein